MDERKKAKQFLEDNKKLIKVEYHKDDFKKLLDHYENSLYEMEKLDIPKGGVLSAQEIIQLYEDKKLIIKGIDNLEGNLTPNGIDLSLSDKFQIMFNSSKTLDLGEKSDMTGQCRRLNQSYVELHPARLWLGSSNEEIGLPSYITATVEGRSSIGRAGIFVHVSAGRVDAGFGWNLDEEVGKKGTSLTLEIISFNPSGVKLTKGKRIAQLTFYYLAKPTLLPYFAREGSKYSNQKKAEHSKSYHDIKKEKRNLFNSRTAWK